jgi:hypothetical protein
MQADSPAQQTSSLQLPPPYVSSTLENAHGNLERELRVVGNEADRCGGRNYINCVHSFADWTDVQHDPICEQQTICMTPIDFT